MAAFPRLVPRVFSVVILQKRGKCQALVGLYRENGKENGNYGDYGVYKGHRHYGDYRVYKGYIRVILGYIGIDEEDGAQTCDLGRELFRMREFFVQLGCCAASGSSCSIPPVMFLKLIAGNSRMFAMKRFALNV